MKILKLIVIEVFVLIFPLLLQSIIFNYFSINSEIIYVVVSIQLLCFSLPVFKKVLDS